MSEQHLVAFRRKTLALDAAGRQRILCAFPVAAVAVLFVVGVGQSEEAVQDAFVADLAALPPAPRTLLLSALLLALDAGNDAALLRRIVASDNANMDKVKAALAKALKECANVSETHRLLALEMLDNAAEEENRNEAIHDSNNELEILRVLASSKFNHNNPLETTIAALVECIVLNPSLDDQPESPSDPSPSPSAEILDFLFGNLESRSLSRLLLVSTVTASSQGLPYIRDLKLRTENAIKESDRLATLFGFCSLFLIDKFNAIPANPSINASNTKEYYYSWLSKLISSLGRRAHQFLLSLLEDTFKLSPTEFNYATIQALRNHTPFKSLFLAIKTHLTEADDVDEKKLEKAGVLMPNEKRNTFSKVMQEFVASGGLVPKSLFMEILVNDAWYKNHFLPRLLTRGDGVTDEAWKHQQHLFDILKKSGKVPSSFLAARATTLANNLQNVGESALSLTQLSEIQTRMTVALQVFIELDDTSDSGFQQDCLASITNLFKTIDSLFEVPPALISSFKFSVNEFGELECFGIYCNKATISIVDTFLNACTHFGPLSIASETRFTQLMRSLITLLPCCVPTLILRIYSLLYGSATLTHPQALVLSRIVYHAAVWVPPSLFSHVPTTTAPAKLLPDAHAPPVLLCLLQQFLTVSCSNHVGTVVDTILMMIQSKPWLFDGEAGVDGMVVESRTRESEVLESAMDTVALVRQKWRQVERRRGVVESRKRTRGGGGAALLDSVVGVSSAREWAVWEVTCPSGVGEGLVARMEYVKQNVRAVVDAKGARGWGWLVCGVCDGVRWMEGRRREGGWDKEGMMLVCCALVESGGVGFEGEEEVGALFGFVDVARFRVLFDLVSVVIPARLLWCVGGFEGAARFWEGKVAGCVGVVEWDVLGQAAALLFEGSLERRRDESEMVVFENFLSTCPTVSAILLAQSTSCWSDEYIPISQLIPDGISSLLSESTLAPFNLYPEIIATAAVLEIVSATSATQSNTIHKLLLSVTARNSGQEGEGITRALVVEVVRKLLRRLDEAVDCGVDLERGKLVEGEVKVLAGLLVDLDA
ncbi:hypothetical protein HDU98_001061 [Podochytrium sp. JEL0797]|nr:hypothetical protein HDU98_001061 [Podochytrium sp. JEL0797]